MNNIQKRKAKKYLMTKIAKNNKRAMQKSRVGKPKKQKKNNSNGVPSIVKRLAFWKTNE